MDIRQRQRRSASHRLRKISHAVLLAAGALYGVVIDLPAACAIESASTVAEGGATVRTLYGSLIETHPDIAAARLGVDASAYGVDAADAGYYPRVSLGSTLGRDQYSNGDGSSSNVERRNVDLLLHQNVYTGGKLTARKHIAQIDARMQEENLRAVTRRVLLDAMTAQIQFTRASLLLKIAQSSEAATSNLASLEQKREKLGGAGATDVGFARTRMALAQERTRQAEIVRDEAASTFRQLFQREPSDLTLPDIAAPTRTLPQTVDAALDLARDRNAELQTARVQRERGVESLALEKAQAYPTAELVASRRIIGPPASVSGVSNDNSIGLQMNYTLYSAGEVKARVGQASAQLDAASRNVDSVQRRIEESIRALWARLASASARIETLRSASDDARSVFMNRMRLREFGRETALAVLDSQLEFNNVLISLVNTTYDRRVNSIRLLAATGELSVDSAAPEQIVRFVDPDADASWLMQKIAPPPSFKPSPDRRPPPDSTVGRSR